MTLNAKMFQLKILCSNHTLDINNGWDQHLNKEHCRDLWIETRKFDLTAYFCLENLLQVAGTKTCFKNVNRCNLHPQCDPVDNSKEDKTAEDERDCDEEYRKKKFFSRQASYRCQSPHHNEDSVKANLSRGVVWIKAVPQDGIKECWKGVDEEPSSLYLTWLARWDI